MGWLSYNLSTLQLISLFFSFKLYNSKYIL